MISFVTKNTYRIEKSILCLEDDAKLRRQVDELFQEAGREIVVIYEDGKYCGYIERENSYDLVIPEHCLGYEPVELEASDSLMEQIDEYYSRIHGNILIPIRDCDGHATGVFATNEKEDNNFAEYLKEYTRLADMPFLFEGYVENKVVVLPELDEITYLCYQILKQWKQECIVEGKYWQYIKIHNERQRTVKEEDILVCDDRFVRCVMMRRTKEETAEILDGLKEKGLKAYRVIIPEDRELASHGELEERMKKEVGPLLKYLKEEDNPSREFWVRDLIVTEHCESEKELLYSRHPLQYGSKEDDHIFLIGPCTVMGTTSTESASIAYMLYQKLVKNKMPYCIKRLGGSRLDLSLTGKVQAADIRKNDVVFHFAIGGIGGRNPNDIDLLEDYNARNIDERWFTDMPAHTLRKGNEMIVDKLYPLTERQYKERAVENPYIQVGKPCIYKEQKTALQKYIDSVGFRKRPGTCAGCIVMNANPFTKGHLYLVEYAAAKVDELLIFVVEEDLSEFTFHDRIEMVRQGVKHLTNVLVVPSGEFILSSHTFVSYFEKDKRWEEKVDAALDVNFFGAYIAPALKIDKRFVGEEPRDMVTRQYNVEMKEKLPMCGVEVIEIPRKEVNGDVISATTVRRLYQNRNWEALQLYLPNSTVDYLKAYNIVMRDKAEIRYQEKQPYIEKCLKERMEKWERVVFYGIGTDGMGLYHLLDSRDKEKVIFCDKRARKEQYYVEGKNVYAPETLMKQFDDLPILITSTQFGRQICSDLRAIRVPSVRMIQNLHSFWAGGEEA